MHKEFNDYLIQRESYIPSDFFINVSCQGHPMNYQVLTRIKYKNKTYNFIILLK
jgi:hypothetical protein